MADNTVGNLNVEITGNAAPLKAALGEAERATRQAGEVMGSGAKEAGEAFDKTTEKVNGLKEAFHGVHKALKFVLLPVMVAKEFVEFVKRLDEMYVASVKLSQGFVDAANAFGKLLEKQGTSGKSELDKSLIENARKAAEELDKINEKIVEERNKREERSIKDKVEAWVAGEETIESLEHDASVAQQRIRDQAEKEAQRLRKEAAEKEEAENKARTERVVQENKKIKIQSLDGEARIMAEYAEKQNELNKRINEAKSKAEVEALQDQVELNAAAFAKDIDDFHKKEEEKTKKANEEVAKRQRAETDASHRMAAAYASEMKKAFVDAAAANRAASDAIAEKIAYSVNRLREIAESQRQSTSRGSSSTAGGVW